MVRPLCLSVGVQKTHKLFSILVFCRSFFSLFSFCFSRFAVIYNSRILDQIQSLGYQHIQLVFCNRNPSLNIIQCHIVLFSQLGQFCIQFFVSNFQTFQFCNLFQSQTKLTSFSARSRYVSFS